MGGHKSPSRRYYECRMLPQMQMRNDADARLIRDYLAVHARKPRRKAETLFFHFLSCRFSATFTPFHRHVTRAVSPLTLFDRTSHGYNQSILSATDYLENRGPDDFISTLILGLLSFLRVTR